MPPGSSHHDPVDTLALQRLRSTSEAESAAAAELLWATYSDRLLRVARRTLNPRARRRQSEEDVVQSVYRSFCQRYRRGEYSLNRRSDFWRLLVTITRNKARQAAIRHAAGRRDVASEGPLPPRLADRGNDPTLALEIEELIDGLPIDLRRVVMWKLAGYTNEDVASPAMLDCTVRTVERKLRLIRMAWDRHVPPGLLSAEPRPPASAGG